MEDEPTLWEFEDAMRFESPCTYNIIHHDDGDVTLEGEACSAEIHDTWVADTKRRLNALRRAGISTSWGPALISRMERSRSRGELRAAFELFEAHLEWEMDKLIEMLDQEP